MAREEHALIDGQAETEQTQLPAAGSQASRHLDDSGAWVATAAEIENQIEQLAVFKDHLTAQLGLLRKEGLCLLEKQKDLAREKHQLETLQVQREAEWTRQRGDAEALRAAARTEYERRRNELTLRAEVLQRLQMRLQAQETALDTGRAGLAQQERDLAARQEAWNAEEARRRAALDAQQQALRLAANPPAPEALTHPRELDAPANKLEIRVGSPAGREDSTASHARRQRARLVRAATRLRIRAQQLVAQRDALAQQQEEANRHEQYLKLKGENLEQVKRLMEKQELIMARKLADHAAIKTVAAVGIFVIMILGITFAGVYWLISPVYRTEAVVQLTALNPQSPPERIAQALQSAMEQMQSQNVTYPAWVALRAGNYNLQDNRQEWLEGLPAHLTLHVDSASRTLSLYYTGRSADGVAMVCNALAAAFVEATRVKAPNARPDDPPTLATAAVAARALPPIAPVEDRRMPLALSTTAVVLFASLLAVLTMRHIVRKQLRDIDQMAEASDWAQARAELATD